MHIQNARSLPHEYDGAGMREKNIRPSLGTANKKKVLSARKCDRGRVNKTPRAQIDKRYTSVVFVFV